MTFTFWRMIFITHLLVERPANGNRNRRNVHVGVAVHWLCSIHLGERWKMTSRSRFLWRKREVVWLGNIAWLEIKLKENEKTILLNSNILPRLYIYWLGNWEEISKTHGYQEKNMLLPLSFQLRSQRIYIQQY